MRTPPRRPVLSAPSTSAAALAALAAVALSGCVGVATEDKESVEDSGSTDGSTTGTQAPDTGLVPGVPARHHSGSAPGTPSLHTGGHTGFLPGTPPAGTGDTGTP